MGQDNTDILTFKSKTTNQMKNLTHILQVYAEVKVKVIIVLGRVQNVELRKRNIGGNLSDFGQGRDTLDTSKVSPMKEKKMIS